MTLTPRKFALGIGFLVAMPIITISILGFTNSFETKQLPFYGTLPTFELVERTGATVYSDDLKHKVWIAGFVFTNCAGQCPLIASKMRFIQEKLRFKDNFRLIAITVDPERDSPKALAAYAKRYDADPYKWLFLTGRPGDIQALVKNGFRLASEGSGSEMTHSDRLVLIDGYGRIRGYYDALDENAIRTLLKDTRKLLRETF